jgi:hypothetical protein
MAPFRGFTGNLNKTPTSVTRPNITYTPPKKDTPSTRGPGSGYTPGGDTYTNYSKEDQEVMFGAAGGKDKFIEMAGNLQQKYPRGLDYQRYLDKSKQYFNALSIGGKEVMGPDGIMRLQMSGADVPMKNAQGQTIMSMMRPELTAQAPTLGQLAGDIGRGAGSMLKGIAKLPGQAFEAYKQLSPLTNILQQAQNYGSQVFNPGDIAGKLQAAGPEAQQKYGQLLQQGMTYQQAFEAATGSPFSTDTTATVPMPMTDTPITNNIGSGVKDYLSKVFNPGDVAGRLQSAGPEAQRRYGQFMQQGIPYQQAFEMATGQKFAMGGVANL